MSEEKREFTVRDQRHFAADGSPRAPQDENATQATTEPGVQRASAAADFSSFVLSLAAQGSVLLRGGDRPAEDGSAHRAQELEAAQQLISILEMLHDKTEGRRTPEESRLLDSLIFELRMAYVTQAQKGER